MKAMKRILAFVLVVCMLSSMLMLTSCNRDKGNDNNDNDNKTSQNTYTVTVVDGDNKPVAGVGVMIPTTTFSTVMTDANGKISFESESSDVKVMIMSVPTGYDKPKSVQTPFPVGSKELTLTVNKTVVVDNTVSYTVTVKDQNGEAVEGVKVQLCANMCVDTTTGADGVGTLKLVPGVKYDVHILGVPEGYTAPEGFEDEIPAGETSIEIEIIKN